MQRHVFYAYLIVICDKETNAVLSVEIWSSPEWEQSRCTDHPTFVAYQVGNPLSYHKAGYNLLSIISHPASRYHWLYQKITPELKSSYGHTSPKE